MKKNVAIIVQKLNGGGAERTASNLSFLLADTYNVHLIVFDGRNIKYPYAGELHDLKLPPVNGKLGKLKNMTARVKKVRKIKTDCKIDAAISLMDGANLVNTLSKGKEKVFTSIRIQMSQSDKRMHNGKAKLSELLIMKLLASKSEKIVAVAKGVEIDMVEHFGVPQEKATTVYNVCDGTLLRAKAQEHINDAGTMGSHCITTMGRLNQQKGQWHLLRAFKSVLQTVPDAELYILGEGELREPLEKLADDLDIAHNVRFMGFVEAPHAYIMNSRVFVLPSLFEGMSNVLLEALACGTPCIATDCESGSREVLAPETGMPKKINDVEYAEFGILTPVGDRAHFNAEEPLTNDEEKLVESIKLLLTDDNCYKKYKAAAEKRIMDFAPEKITKDWESLIE